MKFSMGNNSYRILRKSVFCGYFKNSLWNFISYGVLKLLKISSKIKDAKNSDGSVSGILKLEKKIISIRICKSESCLG